MSAAPPSDLQTPDAEGPNPQSLGADPRASAFVSANAGSGKTRVLVDRVARLLLDGAAPSRVLCLTFTKAAASEMQDRLFQRLGGWAIAPDDTLRAELAALTGGGAADLGAARRLFARALDAPGGLKVQTIHAFCERLLRSFPVEAGLDPGFDVLQDPEAQNLMRLARRDAALAARAEPDGPLARAFAHLAGECDDGTLDGAFAWLAGHRHDLGDLFGRSGGLDSVLRALRARLGLELGATAETIVQVAWDETPKDMLRAAARAMEQGGKTDRARAEALRAALDAGDAESGWALYLAAVRTQKGERFSGGLCSKSVGETAPDILALFGARDAPGSECARIDAVQARLNAAACADLSAALLTIGHRFIARYEARKAQRRALDFSDLIHRARALLEDSAARDWVRYRLDGGIDHVLVDEAQDNSPDQWRIVDASAAEFFAGAGAAARLRTLFAVGDEKQSIFSFQGADPEQFQAAFRRYSALAHDAGLDLHAPPLLTSYRSAPNILAAVDAVFGRAEAAARLFASGGPPSGDIMRHVAHRADRPGCVELWPALPAAESAEDGDPAAPVDAPAPDSPRLVLAGTIALHIRAMIDARTSVFDKETKQPRPMRPGDALILVRSRTGGFFDEAIRQLKLAGLPVAGADRMVLTEQVAAKDLLALARFALLPEDDLSLAELLKSPFFQPYGFESGGGEAPITEDALFDLAHGRAGRLWPALRASGDPRFAEAKAVLEETLAGVGVAAPFDFFSRFLNRLAPEGASFTRRLYARLGPEAEDPVEELLARALARQRAGVTSLQLFVSELESDGAQIKREMESARDEVRVMTVHGAKGLEAPVVILPDATSYKAARRHGGPFADPECGLIWSPRKDDDPPAASDLRAAQEARQDAEYLRLLYVALTRARDHLIVAGWRFGKRSAKNPEGVVDEGCWHELVEAGLRDAGADAVETPAGPGLRLGAPSGAAEAAEAAGRDGEAPPDWAHRPASAAREAAAEWAAPSRLLDEESDLSAVLSPLGAGREARYRRGLLIHSLLELLPGVPPDARAAAGRRFLARRGVADDAAAEMLDAAQGVLDHPDFAHVFGPGSRAELPLAGVLPDGRRVSGAVDRLVVTDAAVLVVDFKTNRPPPARIADADPAYIAQMAAYRALLSRVFPGRDARCALLWTDTPALMEVPAAMMDAALRVRAP